jgi:hypothetical protein
LLFRVGIIPIINPGIFANYHQKKKSTKRSLFILSNQLDPIGPQKMILSIYSVRSRTVKAAPQRIRPALKLKSDRTVPEINTSQLGTTPPD